MADLSNLEALYLQKDRPNLERYVKDALEDGKDIPMPVLDALARFFEDKRQYVQSESLPKLMSLLDGTGDDRGATIRLQKALKMESADGYVASPKKGTSSTYDAFWRYYDARKKEEECRLNPASAGCPSPERDRREKLENPKDFAALLEYALEDGKLDDDEIEAVAKYLGGTEKPWTETRKLVASLLDDPDMLKNENSPDRVLGRKFQAAIGHSETDGIIGGKKESKTLARFWQYRAERSQQTISKPEPATIAPTAPAAPVAPTDPASVGVKPRAQADQTPEYTLLVEKTANELAQALTSGKPLSKETARTVAFCALQWDKTGNTRTLVERASEISGRDVGSVLSFVASSFGFATSSRTVDAAFMDAFDSMARVSEPADFLADAVRAGSGLTFEGGQRILGYVFNSNSTSGPSKNKTGLANLRLLVAEAAKRSGKAEADVLRTIAEEFDFSFSGGTADEKFLKKLDAGSKTTDNHGDTRRMSPKRRHEQNQGSGAESFREKMKGRYVNPRLFRQALDRHIAVLQNRADDRMRIDWEKLAAVVLSKDIPDLYREVTANTARLGHQFDFVFLQVSNDSKSNFERTNRELVFMMRALIEQSENNPASTVDAAAARSAVAEFAGYNKRAYAHYSLAGNSTVKTSNQAEGSSMDIESEAGRKKFLAEAAKKSVNGQHYMSGMVRYYAQRYPTVRTNDMERVLANKSALEIARMATDLQDGKQLPGYTVSDDAQRIEARDLLVAIYSYVSRGILSSDHKDFQEGPQRHPDETDAYDLLDMRTVLREIARDKDITQRKKDPSYIGAISLPGDVGIESAKLPQARELRRTHLLRQDGSTPVLPVNVDGKIYVIESRDKDGWVVVPPANAGLGGTGVVIPTRDKDGIASALARAVKMVRAAK